LHAATGQTDIVGLIGSGRDFLGNQEERKKNDCGWETVIHGRASPS
jgi:hypothetical protein